MNLYELTSEYAAVQQAAEEGEDALAVLESIAGSIEAKGAGIVRVLANLEADANAYKGEAKRLAGLAKARENEYERLREYVKVCMERAGLTKIAGPGFSITLSPGQDKIEVVDLEALEAVAPELVVTSTTKAPDKRAILARFKADGECLPGVEYKPTNTLRVR